MENVDKLVEMYISQWPGLRDLYCKDMPETMLGFMTVDTFIRWTTQKKGPIQHLNIYSLNGDWSDGTYVCIHGTKCYVYTLSNYPYERMSKVMELLDWTSGLSVCNGLHLHRIVFEKFVETRQLDSKDCWMHLYHMSAENAIKIEVNCPPGITIAPLRKEDAVKIKSLWSYQGEDSWNFINEILELSPNVGAYDEHGKLVAWCLRVPSGPHGILQVDETYLRQGLGGLVCRALAKQLGEMGLDSSACVHDNNLASKRTFASVGFKIITRVYSVEPAITLR